MIGLISCESAQGQGVQRACWPHWPRKHHRKRTGWSRRALNRNWVPGRARTLPARSDREPGRPVETIL